VDTLNYQQGQTVTVLGNTGNLVKSGSTFSGWNTASDGSGTSLTQGQTFAMGSANVVLYVVWTLNPTYRVTYNGNGNTGGIVPVDSTSYQQGQTVTVLGNTGGLVLAGSIFSGWNTASDGNGTTYAQGQTFAMGSASVTLYAKWTHTYTVTYSGNGNTGGAVPVDGNAYTQGQTVTVLGNTGVLVQSGSTFSGWNTKADGSGSSYTQGQTFAMGSANVTLYAVWTLNPTYRVTYDGNGNTGGVPPVDSTSYLQGQIVTVLGNTGAPAQARSIFSGWNTASNGRGTTYAQGKVAWEQSGSGVLVKSGSIFSGWNTASDGSGTSYAPGQTFPMGAANVTLYAVWTAGGSFTVTYDGNGATGGTVPVDSGTYAPGQTVTVLGNTGNLTWCCGYIFNGWSDGHGNTYFPGDTFVMGSGNVTLTAIKYAT
jgi:hypothetical protein